MSSTSVRKRPTIRDVAAAAGVSISTVSLYAQGAQRVTEETGQRISLAMQQLGYVYRARGRNGEKRRPALFGLLIEELPKRAFPQRFYGSAIGAIETLAAQHGYSMLFSSTHEDNIPPMVLEEQVAGVIVVGGGPTNDTLAVKLVEHGASIVLLDSYVPGLQIDSVLPDNQGGGYAAIKHLVDLGHRRIAIIEGPRKYRTLTDRLWGALRAADDYGIQIPAHYRQPSISSGVPRKGYGEMKQLLALAQPPTAVFAVSDRAAMGAMDAIRKAELRIPEDISLVGFDDEAYGEHATPPLTTVHYDAEVMGKLAMHRLLDLIAGQGSSPMRMQVLTELVIRQTTRAIDS
jgi:LacI family transcriptional regulator